MWMSLVRAYYLAADVSTMELSAMFFLLLGYKVFKFQGLDALAGGSCEATCLGTETYGICDALHFLSLNSTRALFSTRVNCK
jgi:hypothetical protein